MSEDERKFVVDYSKRASKCQNSGCKGAIEVGSLRLGRVGPNPFGGGEGDMKQYFHPKCIFETLKRVRAATKIIESADDISDFDKIKDDDQKAIVKLIKELSDARRGGGSSGKNKTIDSMIKKKPVAAAKKAADSDEEMPTDIEENDDEVASSSSGIKFETFQKICDDIAATSSHLEKTAVLRKFFDKQKNSKNLTENAYIFYKLLLPTSVNRVFNLDSKQLVKIYSQLFDTDLDEMNDHLNKGDVSETVRHYFKKSDGVKPASDSSLTCAEIDSYLDDLSKLSKESDQTKFLSKVTKRMTPYDLRMFVRLIKKDLRIDAGQKVILESISPNAYQAYQASRDLKDVIERGLQKTNTPGGLKKDISIRVNLMTPVKPMLAEACKSAEQAFAKCKNGILAEIKYDGERLQVHKNGDKYDYFSRNLKKVSEHKSEHLKEYIPKAMPQAKQLILDGEVLLYDTKNKCPLPFGTLGKHKKNKFHDATVCYFIFDCVYYNGESLLNKTMEERRAILEKNIKEIPGRIMLSEQRLIKEPQKLKDLMMDVIKKGLEGLVLKDTKSIYEPGKRHWLKMKKDYLESGSMADTADLVVLGAYYGTGNKGGMKSTFLMGCFNEKTKKWHTVTKVANGLDDKTLAKLQKSIEMVEIKKKESAVPDWLVINKTLVPDFVVKSPEKSPVWELTGAEFSKSDKHTADGISIRFPRITKIRDDKTWKEATSLQRLKKLFEISKQKSDIADEDDEEEEEIEKKPSPSPLKRKLTKKGNDSDEDEAIESKVVKKVRKSPNEDNGLPSIFEDMVFCILPGVPQEKELKRYILAYNGEVIDQKLAHKATHIVLNDINDKLPELKKGVKYEKLTHEKLWEAIKKKKF